MASNKVGKSISRFCSGKEEPPYFPINAAETSETFRLRESTNEGGKGLLSFHPSFFAEGPSTGTEKQLKGVLAAVADVSGESNPPVDEKPLLRLFDSRVSLATAMPFPGKLFAGGS